MRYIYNNQLENIDTPEKAYLLGLYYSDGYVMYKKACYFSGVSLIKTDIELLLDIQRYFPFFKVEIPENKSVALLRCNKMKFSKDLISNGVLPKKSSLNKNNLRFPNINKNFYWDFIRGYFDGDGSICFSTTNSPNSKRFSITSNNYFLVKKIRELCYYEGIFLKFNYIRGGNSIIRGEKVEFKSLTFILYLNNRKCIEKLSKLFYNKETLSLKRKKDIMLEWKDLSKFPKSPSCNRCNNKNTKWQTYPKSVYCFKCAKITTIGKVYKNFDKNLLFCNHCNSKNVVNNGNTRSRTNNNLIGFKLLCRNCNKCSSKLFTALV